MSASDGPLAGIRVLDLAGPPGVFAGRQLGELGAEVVRVEPPGGDEVRRRRPFLDRVEGLERSLYHLHFNANKRSVVLDLESDEGVEAYRRLAMTCDVVIETARPGEMDARGIGFEALRSLNPKLIYVTVTPFGPQGPFRDYAGSDLTGAASSGLMWLNGFPEDPPNAPGAEQAYHMGSLVAVSGALLALHGRERDPQRRGRRVDVSLQEAASMATLQTANANMYAWHGQVPRRHGLLGMGGQRSLYLCRDDRWISFVVPLGAPALFAGFLDWLREEGIGEYAEEGWRDPVYQAQHRAEIVSAIEALAQRHDRAELFREGQRRRMLVMPVNNARDLVEDEHLRERRFFSTVEHAGLGRPLTDVGPPYRFSATPAALRRAAPRLGEDSEEILGGMPAASPSAPPFAGPSMAALAGIEATPGSGSRPLEGIRVADFFWLIAGPATSRILADFGADVIKIESQSRLDNIRTIGVQPSEPGSIDTNGVFNDCNTNKRSTTLNLGHPKGVELAKEIVRRSDVVTNNFTAERMDRWGLGYEELKKVKPDIIMLSMPVMGRSGPYRNYGSYGNGVIAFSGLCENMGFPERPPTGIAPLYSDFSTPYFAASALLAALHHRDRTGEGQFIELAQAEATINLLGTDILEVTANGELPPRLGNRSRDYCPHGAYPCAGPATVGSAAGGGRWCAIAVRSDEEWRRLCAAIGHPGLADDERYATEPARREHEDEADALIAEWTRGREAWEAMRALQAAGVASAVVEDLEDMVTRDPWLSREHLVPVSREDEGIVFTTHAQPMRLDGVTPALRRAPRFGEHNEEVLRGLLGIGDAEYAELLAKGVLY
jgi:crotonobetainyl-CoA:carnitine CoA-transferase CaiB-like acyl-CoA transferase